jgi:hypothetical protein
VAGRSLLHDVTSVEIELARRQWEDGQRRFDEQSRADARSQEFLLAALEAVIAELRKRVGQTFTLGELSRVYAGADDWVRETIERDAPFPGWPRAATTVQDAAFQLYARGAADYRP